MTKLQTQIFKGLCQLKVSKLQGFKSCQLSFNSAKVVPTQGFKSAKVVPTQRFKCAKVTTQVFTHIIINFCAAHNEVQAMIVYLTYQVQGHTLF